MAKDKKFHGEGYDKTPFTEKERAEHRHLYNWMEDNAKLQEQAIFLARGLKIAIPVFVASAGVAAALKVYGGF